MKTLRMMTGLAARFVKWIVSPLGGETDDDRQEAEILAAVRDVNSAAEAGTRKAALGGCYHDGVAYSLGYDANGVVELSGETFTCLDSGIDGGARAALRRHRQNYDPSRDVPRFIVALKPIRVIDRTDSGNATEAYGLPPGPLAGNPPTARVWGGHVAKGREGAIRRALEQVKRDCDRRGIDISESTVTVSVTPHDGQEAFARCEKADRPDFYESAKKACAECSCPYCECDGTCDKDYATSCHRCDTWVCAYCVVEGACHNCFSKMQGGVN